MRTCWEALHASLERSLETLEAREEFEAAGRRRAELRPFAGPGALVDHLTDPGGDLDAKDRVLARLVEIVQERGGDASVATTLLWLGLCPALDVIYWRSIRHHVDDPGELVSELWDCFWLTVSRADLERINRVAATLVRNTERMLRGTRLRAREIEAQRDAMPDDNRLEDGEPGGRRDGSDRGIAPGLPPEVEAERLRGVIAEVVGDDAERVIGAAIYGESQRELADRLGLTHEVARKRYQRALARLRAHLRPPEA